MKKLIVLLLAMLMITCVLAGCGNTTQQPEQQPAQQPAQQPSEQPAANEGASLRIAIVTSPSGVDDGSFNQDNYEGILDFIANNPNSTVIPIRETNVDNSVNAVANILADYDVIVTPGFQFAAIYDLAIDNPDKNFILIDTHPTDSQQADNIYAMLFAEEESGFFAGIAAALESKTGKVAVVNGIAYPSNVNYQWGFESGVNYANKHFGTAAQIVELPSYAGTDVTGANVRGNYVGDFSDEITGKVVGEALLSEGADIIFVAAGASGNGVFTAAKEHASAMVIGCDIDQYDDGVSGNRNIILTSVLKVMRINVERCLNAIADGTFKGENVTLHADTDSTGYVSAASRHQLSDDTLAKLEEAYKLVQSGTIVPAANFNGYTADDFPGL